MKETSTRPSYRTAFPRTEETTWYLVDAADQPVGRVATRIARLVLGKESTAYAPHWDGGQRVVVINAARVRFTGRKWAQKIYYRHSGYIGGLKETKASEMLAKKPEEILRLAVRGMLPKNSLGRRLLKNVRIYAGSEHEHEAQKPQKVEV